MRSSRHEWWDTFAQQESLTGPHKKLKNSLKIEEVSHNQSNYGIPISECQDQYLVFLVDLVEADSRKVKVSDFLLQYTRNVKLVFSIHKKVITPFPIFYTPFKFATIYLQQFLQGPLPNKILLPSSF